MEGFNGGLGRRMRDLNELPGPFLLKEEGGGGGGGRGLGTGSLCCAPQLLGLLNARLYTPCLPKSLLYFFAVLDLKYGTGNARSRVRSLSCWLGRTSLRSGETFCEAAVGLLARTRHTWGGRRSWGG